MATTLNLDTTMKRRMKNCWRNSAIEAENHNLKEQVGDSSLT